MKKLFALLILLPALFLTSCSKDDDEKDGGGGTNGIPTSIVGTWKHRFNGLEIRTSERAATELLESIYDKKLVSFNRTKFEFKANGEFTLYRDKDGTYVKESNGTYKIKENNMLELAYTNPVAKKEECSMKINHLDLKMHTEDKKIAQNTLQAEKYPKWENIEIKQFNLFSVYQYTSK